MYRQARQLTASDRARLRLHRARIRRRRRTIVEAVSISLIVPPFRPASVAFSAPERYPSSATGTATHLEWCFQVLRSGYAVT
jgi:hypothetical protein